MDKSVGGPEGPSGPSQAGEVGELFRPSTEPTAMPLSATQREQHDEACPSWVAILAVKLPSGTVRHPRLCDLVEQNVGRDCLVDNRQHDLVRFVFDAYGSTQDEVDREVDQVTGLILDLLGLSNTAVVERRTIDHRRDASSAVAKVLRLAPEKKSR